MDFDMDVTGQSAKTKFFIGDDDSDIETEWLNDDDAVDDDSEAKFTCDDDVVDDDSCRAKFTCDDHVGDVSDAKFTRFIKQKPLYDGGYFLPPISDDTFLVTSPSGSVSSRNDFTAGSAYHGQRRRSRSKSPELLRLRMKLRQKRRFSAPEVLASARSADDVRGLLRRGRVNTPTTIPGKQQGFYVVLSS